MALNLLRNFFKTFVYVSILCLPGFIELHSNQLQAVLTHCKPLHLLQTTLKTQPHATWNYSWLPNTRKFSNFINFFFNSNDWISSELLSRKNI